MTNNLSLFATDDSCISVITFCFSYFFWLPLDSFNSNILQMTIVSIICDLWHYLISQTTILSQNNKKILKSSCFQNTTTSSSIKANLSFTYKTFMYKNSC